MKLGTFNVNGIGSRLDNLLEWLERERPDVACLQELKAPDRAFPARALRDVGYQSLSHGQSGWNGVAILSRVGAPVEVRRVLPGDEGDSDSRYLEAAVNGVVVACLYLPNGNPQPGPKFAYKLAWLGRLIRHAQTLFNSRHPVILAGDFNVVPTDADIYNPKHWRKDALLQPESREGYARLLAQGWTDALRATHPTEAVFTFWDYFRNHWQRNAGLRIDHVLLSSDLAGRLTAAGVDSWVRGQPHASDHAPVWVQLGAPRRRTTTKRTGVRKKTNAKRAGAAPSTKST